MRRPLPLSVRRRLPLMRGLILDVDGILTDGRLHYGPGEEELKSFHVRDGHGIVRLLRDGFPVGIISGRSGDATRRRLEDLGIKEIHLGIRDKGAVFNALLATWKLAPAQVAVMGDDITDLSMMVTGALSITVPDGDRGLASKVHWVTNAPGGSGAVREVADALLFVRNRGLPHNQEDGLC
ncbi:MAG: KdsC family phosphatase [Leptospirillia bacterium]